MDVSLAVSLVRGQMGKVVERAVNVAVETVLAEMLRVVGATFEELKAELVEAQRGVASLQREKALKEKENDNVRARLRYAELKLKYYRQGVEEELQHRACAGPAAAAAAAAAALLRDHPPADATAVQPPLPHMSQQVKQHCILHADPDAGLRKDVGQDDEFGWTLAPLLPSGWPDPSADHLYVQVPTADAGKPAVADGSPSPDACDPPPIASQVKQEVQEEGEKEEEEEEEGQGERICVKEEPEEEQEVTASLLQPVPPAGPETRRSLSEARQAANQTEPPAGRRLAGHASYSQLAPPADLLPPGPPARPAVRPWTKDLSLYEEYKMRRNELRRRNLSRRRELEKMLPQPLLADMVRERREKTRLRVARWRAKRKLQACLEQVQAQGGAAAQRDGPVGSQQLRGACASSAQQSLSSAAPPTNVFLNSMSSPMTAVLPFIPSSSSSFSSSSSSVLQLGLGVAPPDHGVPSSSLPLVSQSQQSMAATGAVLLL